MFSYKFIQNSSFKGEKYSIQMGTNLQPFKTNQCHEISKYRKLKKALPSAQIISNCDEWTTFIKFTKNAKKNVILR